MTPVPATMRAVLYDRYGPPEVLREGRLPIPEPAAGEVVVKVHTTSVNGGELFGRSGAMWPLLGRRFPKRVGIDFVGEVAGLGGGVTESAPGDRVWGTVSETTFGAAAEYVAVPAWRVAPAPRNLSAVDAVALVAGGTTSITALTEHARLQPGERLLVRGAAGGVGSLAVQLGKHLGAEVTGLAGKAALDQVRDLGADQAFDYRTTGPDDLGAFDVIVDTIGLQQPRYRRLLAPGGRMVAVGLDLDRLLRSFAYVVFSRVYGGRRVRFFRGKPDRQLLTELTVLAESGVLRPIVDRVYPLERIADAHRALEAGGIRGKVVVTVDPSAA
ncbi:NAD(P)-dependent alcohol dehydrogenase [Raineyella sp. LH-20]|uniref:NAD(P)-dependent alcohol dehydrogenase n=1 Tax=Raineyella sp. LH-20 TaxID=3081204 RepID=UPI0029549F08|nr:NAD(P)-dependent alcohol dehydrogenase [Raineyella sp. LH-20]WOP19547.1 NAD(P)-dependent alcohol dehydrogenase [Raineyella sp. LH-20]